MSNQSQKNTTVATATYTHPEKNALILTTAFLALSANIFGQNPENKTDNPREKKTSRIEKIKGNISSTLIAEGEAQLGDNAKQTAQAIGIVEMNAELNNLFAQIKFSGGVSNCPDDNQFITLCTEFLANVGIKLDDGTIRLSAGKINLMNDYASTSNLTNIASIGNQNMDLGCL